MWPDVGQEPFFPCEHVQDFWGQVFSLSLSRAHVHIKLCGPFWVDLCVVWDKGMRVFLTSKHKMLALETPSWVQSFINSFWGDSDKMWRKYGTLHDVLSEPVFLSFSLFSMKMRKLQKNLKLPASWTWFETVAELAFLIAPKVSERHEPLQPRWDGVWITCLSSPFTGGIQLGNLLICFHRVRGWSRKELGNFPVPLVFITEVSAATKQATYSQLEEPVRHLPQLPFRLYPPLWVECRCEASC